MLSGLVGIIISHFPSGRMSLVNCPSGSSVYPSGNPSGNEITGNPSRQRAALITPGMAAMASSWVGTGTPSI
jgi:hypothetical protein